MPLPAGEDWHLDLFQRFRPPAQPPLRTLFDDGLARQLGPFRRFRHVVHHGYGFQIEWDRMREGLDQVGAITTLLKADQEGRSGSCLEAYLSNSVKNEALKLAGEHLTGDAKFPDHPDVVLYPPFFEWNVTGDINSPVPHWAENDGTQIIGYFYPPANGESGGTGSGTPAYPNAWLRMRRRSQTFAGFYSADGVKWTSYGSQTLTTQRMPDTLLVGRYSFGRKRAVSG